MTPEIQSLPKFDQLLHSKSMEEQVGTPWLVSQNPTSRGKLWLGVLILLSAIGVGSGFFAFFNVQPANEAQNTSENFQRIGLAVSNYRLVHDQPPSNSYDAAGKPLLSWRVHLLPFLGQKALYQQFKLDEPWNSPSNIQLPSLMPEVYRDSKAEDAERGTTMIRAFSSAGSVMEAIRLFQAKERLKAKGIEQKRFSESEITDGEENTIFAIESGEPVEWTKTEDIALGIGEPLPTLGGNRQTNDFFLITLDGTVLRMSKSITPMQLKALITIAGGETFDFDDNDGPVKVKNLR